MQIKIAKHSGFCFGVHRAIDIAHSALKDAKNKHSLYSLGPIIHNPQVVDSLCKKGIKVIKILRGIKGGAVIISSHGAPLRIIERLKRKNITIIDATCPFVKYAQNIVKDLKRQGYQIIIVGDRIHPEVKALRSIAGKKITSDRIGIISQTTQNKNNYIKEISGILESDFKEVRIFDTICKDASKRQASTRELLKECDFMVVVGGKNSANTKRLWQICKESGVDCIHIERDSELNKKCFKGKRCVGITSGASTPDEMVKLVCKKIKSFK